MKVVITGGAGHISRPLAEKLLTAGHDVTIIGRNAEHLKSLTEKGANPAIGSVEDPVFLKKTFAGADAVYTMVPPKYDLNKNLKEHTGQVGKHYAEAIKASSIKYVVNLSSVGAHLSEGCGPVSGLYRVEQSMNQLNNVSIRHLRPVYFYTNFLGNKGMVKNMNILGGNFGGPGFKMLLVDTDDIAAVAFEELNELDFTGHSVRYIASDERTTDEIAHVLGAAVGKPQLPWIVFTDEQALGGLLQMGFPGELARNFVEMGNAMRSGIMFEEYWKNRPATLGKTKLEDFAGIFAAVYNQD